MLTTAASVELVPFLMARMAPEEVAKLDRVTGGYGALTLARNVDASTVSWAGIDAAGVVNLGGVFPLAPGVGYVWQVVTPAVALHKRAYIRQGRAMMSEALAQYGRLTTLIAAEYGAALRHIHRLGFDVDPAQAVGADLACRCHCERGF